MAALSRAYRDQTFFVNTITTEQHRPSSLRQTSLFVSRNLRICRAARSLSARYINRWSTSKTRIVARAWVCDTPTVWGYRAALPLHDRVNPLTVSSNCARMGCDGGTIPKRDELVRTKKKAEQVRYKFIWFFCPCGLASHRQPRKPTHKSIAWDVSRLKFSIDQRVFQWLVSKLCFFDIKIPVIPGVTSLWRWIIKI